jgi:type III secretion protein Q
MQTFDEKTLRAELTTFRVARMYRLGSRRLSRAHLALNRRPTLRTQLGAIGQKVCDALSVQLEVPVEGTFCLLDNVFTVERNVAPGCALAIIDLDGAGEPAILEVEKPLLGVLLERLSGGPTRFCPATELTRIEEAAFGFLVLLGVQAARGQDEVERLFAPRVRRVNPSFEELLEGCEGKGALVGFRFVLQVGEVRGQGRLFVPARTLKAALETEPEPACGPLPEALGAACIPLRTFAGALHLSAEELRALRPGDCVLLDQLQRHQGAVLGPLRLQSSSFELFGAFCSEGFTLRSARARRFPQERSMSSPHPDAQIPTLPVEVEVELTRLLLPVSELATLRPGSILPLRINGSDPVILRIGDRAVARAELVEIEGEVGARILSLLS